MNSKHELSCEDYAKMAHRKTMNDILWAQTTMVLNAIL